MSVLRLVQCGFTPLMEEFKTLYPNIEVHIVCSEKQLDMAMLEADVALLQHPSKSLGLIQKKVMHNRIFAYVSQEYLERRGIPIPKVKRDLDHHNIIVYDQSLVNDDDYNSNWLLTLGKRKHMERRPYLTINNLHGMYRMVRSGSGIAALPEFMEGLPGGLVKILPEEQGPEFDTYIVYPEEYKNTLKVQVFKNFLVEKTTGKG